MQKTNFRFEAIVHDDASTDGSADIIREYAEKYPDIIKPIIEQENQYSKHDGSLMRIVDNASKGKYIAICEGDDYWTNPYKLQKQVDYLESKSDIGMVHTAYTIYYENNNLTKVIRDKKPHCRETHKWDIIQQDVMIGTCTVLMHNSFYSIIKQKYSSDFNGYLMGDTQLWFHFARDYGIGYLDEVTACYRKNEVGATGFYDNKKRLIFLESARNLDMHLGYTYGASENCILMIKNRFMYSMIPMYLIEGDYDKIRVVCQHNHKNHLLKFYIGICRYFHIRNKTIIKYSYRMVIGLSKLLGQYS